MKLKDLFLSEAGDSNPLNVPWVDTWHEAQHMAFANDPGARARMARAAKEATQGRSVGEAKYYMATVAWLQGNYRAVKQYSIDPDVKKTGNDQILLRLLKNTGLPYKIAYSS